MENFNAGEYWDKRLSRSLDLDGVGCLGKGINYNNNLYRAKKRAFERGLKKIEFGGFQEKTLLDLGSGTGFWINYYLTQGAKFCAGVDISKAAVQHLSKIYKPPRSKIFLLEISNPELPPMISNRFEMVSAFDVLYHIVDDDLIAGAISNVGKLVKQGGWFVFSDAIHINDAQVYSGKHVRWRTEENWRALLVDSGFVIEAEVPMYMFVHPAVSGPRSLRLMVNLLNYGVVNRYSETPYIGNLILKSIYMLDSITTRFGGTSLHLMFAKKQYQ